MQFDKVSDKADTWGEALKRIGIEAAYNLARAFSQSIGQGGFSLSKILGSVLPGFASGGYLAPGQFGITGEKGAEIIQGAEPYGTNVIPMGKMQAGGEVNVNMQPIVYGNMTEAQMQRLSDLAARKAKAAVQKQQEYVMARS